MINKDYILTDHAKTRMKERGISENDIKEVLENPEYSYTGKEGEVNAVKTIGKGKTIRVVYKTKGKKKIIITVIKQ